MFFSPKQVLVVAAHPDDEMLGCGGFLAKLRSYGVAVTILLLGEGPTARVVGGLPDRAQEIARNSALAASEVLGITDVRFAGLPDNRFDSIPLLEVIRHVELTLCSVSPDLVLTHFCGDLNIDHQIAHRAVMTSCRPLPGVKPVTILSFEVLSSTEYTSPEMGTPFAPTLYVDIDEFLGKKQAALQAYASEMRAWPHPRSVEAVESLARVRGSQCGRNAAEAFMLCRAIG